MGGVAENDVSQTTVIPLTVPSRGHAATPIYVITSNIIARRLCWTNIKFLNCVSLEKYFVFEKNGWSNILTAIFYKEKREKIWIDLRNIHDIFEFNCFFFMISRTFFCMALSDIVQCISNINLRFCVKTIVPLPSVALFVGDWFIWQLPLLSETRIPVEETVKAWKTK